MQTVQFQTSVRVFAERAAEIVRRSDLVGVVARLHAGDFGIDADGVSFLERLTAAIDLGLQIAETIDIDGSFRNALVWVVVSDQFELATVDEPMELDGLAELLQNDTSAFLHRSLSLHAAYLNQNQERPEAFLALLRDAVMRLSILQSALHTFSNTYELVVDGIRYDGWQQRIEIERPDLLPSRPEQIVGNDAYLERGLRLARDVAAFDRTTRRNPKTINPVLFGLGKPGCGKTISAHAIGNYFLDFCSARAVPAQFRVVRRTDWASSYQNASAANLVQLFTDAKSFDGVTGFYWPDIDTAFASRSDQGLRSEEKQNLGAAFGIFDGTLLPRDGSWFLICDANTMNMDPATVSRIAQQPCNVSGPVTAEDYVRLTRDILLDDVREFVPSDDWEKFGERCVELAISGRNIESVANNIIAEIQDFDMPDAYFDATPEQREAIVRALYRPIEWGTLFEQLETFAQFHREAEEEADREKFAREVQEIVRRLNAHALATGSIE